jgi:hypothetical protein
MLICSRPPPSGVELARDGERLDQRRLAAAVVADEERHVRIELDRRVGEAGDRGDVDDVAVDCSGPQTDSGDERRARLHVADATKSRPRVEGQIRRHRVPAPFPAYPGRGNLRVKSWLDPFGSARELPMRLVRPHLCGRD